VVTPSKFAILTNGIIYKIYTDLDEPNKMDDQPFLEFSILDIRDSTISELRKFNKSNFDLETIFNSASELKYSNQIKQILAQQLDTPTESFVEYILGLVYTGRKTQNIKDKFKDVVKKSFNQFINELMSERIKSALEAKHEDKKQIKENVETEEDSEPVSKIVTSENELEGYFIVKSILRDVVQSNRITYKDTESYFGILLDNNSWKWICRLSLGQGQKSIIIPDENKKSIKYNIADIDELYSFKEKLTLVVNRYL